MTTLFLPKEWVSAVNLIRIFASFIPLFLLVGGCATPGASLRLSTSGTRTNFVQHFDQAYIGQSQNGDLMAVLIDEPKLTSTNRQDAAITPTASPPLQQVVVLHILWRPLSGAKSDNPSAANATLDWYVTPTGTRRGMDLLHYQGAALVMVYGSGSSLTLQVRNANLKPVEIRGQMADPLGPATLHGSITALNDTARINQALTDIRSLESPPSDSANARLGPHPNPPAP